MHLMGNGGNVLGDARVRLLLYPRYLGGLGALAAPTESFLGSYGNTATPETEAGDLQRDFA